MTAREETVLPPIDPSVTDENDWWEFELTDVKVLRPGKMLYANVLDASDDNPVQVIGCLELKKNQEHLGAYSIACDAYPLDPDSTSNRIIIDDVTHYAYGQTEDRSVEIWVAGKAGWYLISPAKGYLPTFNRMVRAVDMLYFLIDRHKQGKKQINPTFKNLCRQYIFHTHGDCETGEQSAEAFAEHAPFLLRCMIEDEYESMDWKQTNVFVHFRRQFPDEYKKLVDQQSPQPDDDEDEEMPTISTPRHDTATISKSQTDAVYQLIHELKDEGHLAKRRLNFDLLAERLSARYAFNKDDARKILGARSNNVLERLDQEDREGETRFKWSRYVIHRELSEAASQHTSLPPSLLTPLPLLDDSSDDEELGRTQKSVLRPKNASVSKKVMGKRNRSIATNQQTIKSEDEDEDDDDTHMEDVDTPSKSRGHELIRTPLASENPRPQPDFTPTNPRTAAASLLKSVLSGGSKITPASTAPTTGQWTSEISIVNAPEESETWACRMPGCTTILTSKGPERRQEIEDHAGEHDWEVQMRVELVETERRMHSTMPVSNLMKYLVGQHLKQKRTAFPELYPPDNGEPIDPMSMFTPKKPKSAQRQEQVNGHNT
ncbi:hypothetical protein N7448_003400 [Penicillium atrosanguineum]|uniref:DNA (cytosine-5)-methyltransferase 1 replication foci domain-containing protein n=1 Tax=Penicillium atrosanguineum TaxID=1132637 RepID=A0A9W9L7I6_9EURO|nr:uncharacterized protein N7443_002368 [Penicillium atrosanguineum]KAJ5122268.1 hypothetical protein N7526_009205 [Penicillium atrosanguineum]KAJ5139992.1 hypothetical protein N7448_003400 [Penicillium atrosanguineum]KAJ5309907.1 hypothetical protein N7443_002368 [Penicillium atrosanguineum]KAJ5315426.1 hypothetical protein N7476_005733 [Penicillium atrosanguineum]